MDDNAARAALARLTERATAGRFYDGTIAVADPTSRHVTVVIDGEGSGTVAAYRGTFEPIVGARVTVERVAGTKEYRITGVARDALADRTPAPYDFERLGVPMYYPIAPEALNRGAYNLSASGLDITVYNAQWVDADGVLHYIASQTLDLTASVPVTDWRWVVIRADPSDDTLDVYDHTTTATPAGGWVEAVNAAYGAGLVPVLAVLLQAGTTTWQAAHKNIARGYSYAAKWIISVPYPADVVGTVPPVPAFIDLPDVPNSYSGQAGLTLRVNATEDALEFVAGVSGTITVGDGGTPVEDIDTVIFDGATVTDDGAGQVTVSIDSVSPAIDTVDILVEEILSTVTLASTSATITLTPPTSGYREFIVNVKRAKLNAFGTTNPETARVRFNGDNTGSNYASRATDGSTGTTPGGVVWAVNPAGAGSGYWSTARIRIPNPHGTTDAKSAHGMAVTNSTVNAGFWTYGLVWYNTAAITSIELRQDDSATNAFAVGTEVELIGIKEQTVITGITF